MIKDTIKNIKYNRLSKIEKLIFDKLINLKVYRYTNDTTFLISPENNVMVEICDIKVLSTLVRINYENMWLDINNLIDIKGNKKIFLNFLNSFLDFKIDINHVSFVGGVSVKYLPYKEY